MARGAGRPGRRGGPGPRAAELLAMPARRHPLRVAARRAPAAASGRLRAAGRPPGRAAAPARAAGRGAPAPRPARRQGAVDLLVRRGARPDQPRLTRAALHRERAGVVGKWSFL